MEKDITKDYIFVTDRFWLKQCKAHVRCYDIFEYVIAKSGIPRMQDFAYGCSLPRALELIAHALVGQEAGDILELSENLKKTEKEFLNKVEEIVKQSK